MAFLFPSFLWALGALAIPIIIHLFQLRRFKRMEFSNVRFLQEVSQRTRSRKQVKHWLVLLARLLALACLVLAFAQPYLPSVTGAVKAGQRGVSLFVDDSWSMDGTDPQGRLLDQARKQAQDAVLAYKATDRFQVLTNTFEGRQQMLISRDEALEAAAQAEAGPYSRLLSHVIQRQREALSRSDAPVKQAFLFTDLQRSITDVEAWRDDSSITTTIVPIPSTNADNLAIDSVWFASPVRRLGQSEALHVRVRNFGQLALENVPLKLTIDGRQRALGTFAVEAQSTVDTVLRFTNDAVGNHSGQVSLTDRPITFDDDFHIAYRTAEHLRVALVSGGENTTDGHIAAVFEGDSLHRFSVQPYRQVDLASLAKTDLVILNALPDIPSGLASALEDFVQAGGSLALFPGKDPQTESWNALLASFGTALGARDTASVKVERIDLRHPFFGEVFTSMPKNVDLPVARSHFRITAPPGSDVLLRAQNGDAFLTSVPAGKGRTYIYSTTLAEEGGNFSQHALFVTSLLRMAELARPMGSLYHTLGAEAVIPLDGIDVAGDQVPHLLGPDKTDLIPEVRRTLTSTAIALPDEDLTAGSYMLALGSDTLARLALNLPRQESDLSAYTVDGLKEMIAQHGLTTFNVLDTKGSDITQQLSQLDQGVKLWKWFILAALLFLALEILLIRTLP